MTAPHSPDATADAVAVAGSGHLTDALWVVTELSVEMASPPNVGGTHPERTPVGPFASREAADRWASRHVGSFGGSGSWSVAPLVPPTT